MWSVIWRHPRLTHLAALPSSGGYDAELVSRSIMHTPFVPGTTGFLTSRYPVDRAAGLVMCLPPSGRAFERQQATITRYASASSAINEASNGTTRNPHHLRVQDLAGETRILTEEFSADALRGRQPAYLE